MKLGVRAAVGGIGGVSILSHGDTAVEDVEVGEILKWPSESLWYALEGMGSISELREDILSLSWITRHLSQLCLRSSLLFTSTRRQAHTKKVKCMDLLKPQLKSYLAGMRTLLTA